MTRIAALGAACVLTVSLAFPNPALAQGRGPGSYSMTGVVVEVDDDDIEIDRDGLPRAELEIKRRTRITLDGQDARIHDLRPGMQVDARFEVVDDDVVATEIVATSSGSR